MIARMFKWCSALLGAMVLLVVAAVYAVYWLGLRSMPAEFAPTAHHYPAPARLALWRSAGGVGEPRFGQDGPLMFTVATLAPRVTDRTEHDTPEMTIRFQLARRLVAGKGRHPRLAEIATTLRMGREWRSDQILDTALDRMYLGEHATGVAESAQRYFGKPDPALTPQQLQLLLALAWSPNILDPWCRPGQLESRLSSLAIDPLSPGDAAATLGSLAPKPADHACR